MDCRRGSPGLIADNDNRRGKSIAGYWLWKVNWVTAKVIEIVYRFQWITLMLSGIGFGAATVELISISQAKPFVQATWQLVPAELGLITTCTFAGEICGSMLWGWFGDRFGREPAFLITSVIMAFSSLVLPLLNSFNMFCLARFALGVAIGGGLGVDFVYFLECCPTDGRSFRTAYIVLIGILGLLYSAVMGVLFLDRWQSLRGFLMACAWPSVALMLGRWLWRYESPKYLAAKGRTEEAEVVLKAIEKINKSSASAKPVHSDGADLQSAELNAKGSDVLMASIALASAIFFSQSSAYYGLTLWIGSFLRPWGLSSSLSMVFISLAELPGLFLTALLLRRQMLSPAKMLQVNFICAALITVLVPYTSDGRLAVLAFCLLYSIIVSNWTLMYRIGKGPRQANLCSYTAMPEMFPVQCRSRCFGAAGMAGKIGGLLSPTLFGILMGRNWSTGDLHWVSGGLFLAGAGCSMWLGKGMNKCGL